MRKSIVITLVCVALGPSLGGCVSGKDFARVEVDRFKPGITKKTEVIEKLGPPAGEDTFTMTKDVTGKKMEDTVLAKRLRYFYSEGAAGGDSVLPDVRPHRAAHVYLVDDTLIGYYSASSFRLDSTDFDLGKASAIEKGKTTEQQIYALFGKPSGRGIYPWAASASGRSVFYDVTLWNSPPGVITSKILTIQLTADGIVEDFSANSKTDSVPAAPPAPVYIYLPTKAR